MGFSPFSHWTTGWILQENLSKLLHMTPLEPLSTLTRNDRQVWGLLEGGLRRCPSALCTWWTVWINLTCSGSVGSTVVCTDGCFDHRKQLHVWNTSSSSSSNYNKSRFLLRLHAQLRRETITAHRRLLTGAHVNLTENTIVSPAMWNMFSHA